MHLLRLLFTSLCFSDPSGSNLFFLSSLLLSHRSKKNVQWPSCCFFWFFFLTMFAMNLTGFRSHCFEGFQHIRIFQPFEVKLESSVFWLVGSWFFFRRRRKVIASNSRSLPMSAPGKLPVPALFTPKWKRFLECNQSVCGVVHLGYGRCSFSMFCDDQKCLPTQDK